MSDNYKMKDLYKISTSRWLLSAAQNWAEIILYFYLASLNDSLLWTWVASLFIGVRMHGLALLGHEGVHGVISKNKKLNDLLMTWLCAYPILQSKKTYYSFHIGHHRHLGNEGKDPEIQYRKHTPDKWFGPISRTKAIKIIITDLLGIGVLETRHLFLDNKQLKPIDLLPQFAFWAVGYAICIYFDALWIPLLWTFSLLTSYWAAFRMRGLVEHIGTEGTNRYRASLLERYFYMPHSSWHHYEHHKWPGVPFYNLKFARQMDQNVPIMNLSAVLFPADNKTKNIFV